MIIYTQTESDPKLHNEEDHDWVVVDTTSTRQLVFYEGTQEPFLDVTYTIRLKRMSERLVETVLIPVFCTTILAILSNLIPNHHPLVRLLVLLITINIIFLFTWTRESHIGILGNLIGNSYMCLFILIIYSIIKFSFTNNLPPKTSDQPFCFLPDILPGMPDRARLSRLADILVTALLFIGFVGRLGCVLNMSS